MTFLVYSNSFPSVPEGTVKHATDKQIMPQINCLILLSVRYCNYNAVDFATNIAIAADMAINSKDIYEVS